MRRLNISILLIVWAFFCSQTALPCGEEAILNAPPPEDATYFILDAASGGTLLAPAFKRLGKKVAHIQSRESMPDWITKSLDLDPFGTNLITHRGSLYQTMEAMEQLAGGSNKIVVVPGADSSVLLNEQLNNALLKPWGNDPNRFRSRVYKYDMIEAARSAGLNVVNQLRIDLTMGAQPIGAKAQAFGREHGFPIVAKPDHASGGELVFYVPHKTRLRDVMRVLRTSTLRGGSSPQAAVLQTMQNGSEFSVNGVASRGHIVITDIFFHDREVIPGRATIYRSDQLVAFDDPAAKSKIEYALKAIPAFGFHTGPFHLELKGDGMLEFNARSCGGGLPGSLERATGRNFGDLVALAYVDPAAFSEIQSGYQIKEHFTTVQVNSPKNGTRLRPGLEDRIRALPGVADIDWEKPSTSTFERTEDLDTIIATVFVFDKDATVVEETVLEIQRMQDSREIYQD